MMIVLASVEYLSDCVVGEMSGNLYPGTSLSSVPLFRMSSLYLHVLWMRIGCLSTSVLPCKNKCTRHH
jgi:hypothetical protein